MFRSEDDVQHKNFYRQSIKKYGVKDVRSLHWNSSKTQQIRFKVLTKVGDIHNKTVLDLGSGTGDFYGFLISQKIVPKRYIGVDFLDEFILSAKKKYPQPGCQWVCSDFFTIAPTSYDFIICNGALNVKREDNMEFLKKFFLHFVPQAKIGLGVTLLKYAPGYIDNPMIYTYDPELVKELLTSLQLNYTIYRGYIDNDFTLIIHKGS